MPQATNSIDLSPTALFDSLYPTEKCHLLALLATWQQQVLDDELYSLENAVIDSMFELSDGVTEWIRSMQNQPTEFVLLVICRLANDLRVEVERSS